MRGGGQQDTSEKGGVIGCDLIGERKFLKTVDV